MLRASDDGLSLIVRNFSDKHKHQISRVRISVSIITVSPSLFTVQQELFKQLPQQRKFSLNECKETENLLLLKANKKMVQDKLIESTG